MSGRPALLDVNVLIALFDPDHIHHEPAHDWFADHESDGWATCPITENGLIRVLGHPAYGAVPLRTADLIKRLRKFCSGRHHRFWTDSFSVLDESLFAAHLLAGHRQLTDVYLVALAKKNNGLLATFDRTIPMGAVVGATRATLSVIGAAGEDK